MGYDTLENLFDFSLIFRKIMTRSENRLKLLFKEGGKQRRKREKVSYRWKSLVITF